MTGTGTLLEELRGTQQTTEGCQTAILTDVTSHEGTPSRLAAIREFLDLNPVVSDDLEWSYS